MCFPRSTGRIIGCWSILNFPPLLFMYEAHLSWTTYRYVWSTGLKKNESPTSTSHQAPWMKPNQTISLNLNLTWTSTQPSPHLPTHLPGIHRGKDVRKLRQHRRRLLRQGGTCIDAEMLEVAKPGGTWRRRLVGWWVGGEVVKLIGTHVWWYILLIHLRKWYGLLMVDVVFHGKCHVFSHFRG